MAEAHRDEIAKLEALFAANPDGRIFTHLAEAYRKAGELDRARETVERGLERHGEYPSAHVVLGRVLWDLGETSGAEQAFRRVLELDPENRVALRGLGDLARVTGRAMEAVGHYRALLLLDPSDEEVEELARLAEEEAGLDPFAGEGDDEGVAEPDAAEAGLEAPVTESPVVGADPAEPAATGPEEPIAGDPTAEALPDMPSLAEVEGGVLPEESAGDDAMAELERLAAELPSLEAAVDGTIDLDAGELDLGVDDSLLGELEPGFDEAPVVTETMGDVYARQGLYERAAGVYRELLAQRPGDARLEAKLAELERTAAGDSALGEALPGESAGDDALADLDRSDIELPSLDSGVNGAIDLDGFEGSAMAGLAEGEALSADLDVESLVEGGDAGEVDAVAPPEGFDPFGGMELGANAAEAEPPVASVAEAEPALAVDGGPVLELEDTGGLAAEPLDGLEPTAPTGVSEDAAAVLDLADSVVLESGGQEAAAPDDAVAGADFLALGETDVLEGLDFPAIGDADVVERLETSPPDSGDAAGAGDAVMPDVAGVVEPGEAEVAAGGGAVDWGLDGAETLAAADSGAVKSGPAEVQRAEADALTKPAEAAPEITAGAVVEAGLPTSGDASGAAATAAAAVGEVTPAASPASMEPAGGASVAGAPEVREAEPTIGAYFRALLGFRRTSAPVEASAGAAATSGAGAAPEDDPANGVLELGEDAVVAGTEGSGDEFDRLFDGPAGVEPVAEAGPVAGLVDSDVDDDTDEDLEMFRAWLQNLKH